MEFRVIHQNTPWDRPDIQRTRVGLMDLTESIKDGTQIGIAEGFLNTYYDYGLIFKDFYNYMKSYTPKFNVPKKGIERAYMNFMIEKGFLEKKMFRYQLTAKGHDLLKDLNSPNRV